MSKLSVNELTDETGSGAPSFPNGVSVTGAALTDPEITGGIYLGGTGSANYLDDYEEGTWTPSDASGAGLTLSSGGPDFYTKTSRQVHIVSRIAYPSNSSTADAEITLPFPVVSSASQWHILWIFGEASPQGVLFIRNTNSIRLYNNLGQRLSNQDVSGKTLLLNAIYTA